MSIWQSARTIGSNIIRCAMAAMITALGKSASAKTHPSPTMSAVAGTKRGITATSAMPVPED